MKYGFKHNISGDLHYLTIPSFLETNLTRHCFTTRLGGVSPKPLDSMNLGIGRGDKWENVLENYRIIGEKIGFNYEKLVGFTQVHGCDIYSAANSDIGNALFRKNKDGFDGIATNVPDLPIVTYHADCVPVFLLDPVERVVSVVHAGWKGTALKSPLKGVEAMCSRYGCKGKNILAAIGPSILQCCFETNSDVPEAMVNSFGNIADKYILKNDNKWHVDLQGLNSESLLQSGVLDSNITICNECTSCNHDLYWSHRKTNGIRGAMAAIIMLK